MLELVYTGITTELAKEFETENIFVSNVKQGYKNGDLVVEATAISSTPVPSDMLKVTAKFSVFMYFEGEHEDKLSKLDKLEKSLNLIYPQENVCLKANFTEMKCESDKITIECEYSYYISRTEDAELMGNINCLIG